MPYSILALSGPSLCTQVTSAPVLNTFVCAICADDEWDRDVQDALNSYEEVMGSLGAPTTHTLPEECVK